MKFFSDILTGKDNLTYDAARVVGVLGAAAYIAFWAVQVACVQRFAPSDADAYGRGLAMVLLAMAGAVAIKRSTEPDPDPSPARNLAPSVAEPSPGSLRSPPAPATERARASAGGES